MKWDHKPFFDELSIQVNCVRCGTYYCDADFEWDNPNNTEVCFCEKCEQFFSYRLNLTTSISYFKSEIIDETEWPEGSEKTSFGDSPNPPSQEK